METQSQSAHRVIAILQALLVAFLWATSWVLIKAGLQDIPPVVFAGLRYFLAFLILLVVHLAGARKRPIAPLPRAMVRRVVILGLLMYTLAQGTMFIALKYLPAVTLNLMLNFISLGVALVSAAWLSEKPTSLQWVGLSLAVTGAMLYFYPVAIPPGQLPGFLAAAICIAANVLGVIVGREVNSARRYPPLQVTLVSMGAGSAAMLAIGLVAEGLPAISARNWAYILWLAAVNTAFAFTLWNHTLRTLTATESSISTGTMLIWIPILAVVFLGEHITAKQVVGLMAVGAGTLLVQLRGNSGR